MVKQIVAGLGFVGSEVKRLFPDADVYDPKLTSKFAYGNYFGTPPDKEYDFCHVCVPTPMKEDGSCDTSMVEDVIKRINAEIYIVRSTVPPGTCHMLELEYGVKIGETLIEDKKLRDIFGDKADDMAYKNIVMQPEYVASSSQYPAPLADMKTRDFIILGGRPEITKKVRRLYETVYPPTIRILETDSKTAEIIKYAENAFIVTKVTFCNEIHAICKQFNSDYDVVREGVFKLDPRMTEWWTLCQGKGWGGHCLPKDMASLAHFSDSQFFKDIIKHNERHKEG